MASGRAEDWPFLVVFGRAGNKELMLGFGVVVDGTHLGTVRRSGSPPDIAIEPGGRMLARVRFDVDEGDAPSVIGTLVDGPPDVAKRAAEFAAAVPGSACTIASVDDHRPVVVTRDGQIGKIGDDGRFRISISPPLPEYETALGSPVVVDGEVVGLVGGTAGSTGSTGYVDAFVWRPPEASEDEPPLGRDAQRVVRTAVAMLPDGETAAGQAEAAVLLAALGEAEAEDLLADNDEVGQKVSDELTRLFTERHPNAAGPREVIEAAVHAAGLQSLTSARGSAIDVALELSPIATSIALARGLARSVGAREVNIRHLLGLPLPAATEPVRAALAVLGITAAELYELLLGEVARTVADESLDDWRLAVPRDLAVAPLPEAYDLAGGFSADSVDPTTGIPMERDELGVRTYVAMLATVIADAVTPMPLSIGLFGEWGSGKSTFMGLLRGHVDALAESGSERYLRHIRQIGFNAWNYADTNLWASLGQEIFEQLAGRANHEQAQREALQAELSERLQTRQELEDATQRAQAETARLRAQLDVAARRNASSARKLAAAAAASPELAKAWKQLDIDDEAERGRLLAEELRGGAAEHDALRTILQRAGWQVLLVAALVAGVLAAVTLLLGEWIAGGGLVAVSGVLGTALAFAARMRSGLAHLRKAAAEIEDGLVADELDELRAAEASQQVLQAQLDEVVGRVGELGRELAELAPGRRLYSFVTERAAGDEYRSHLGLISTVRRDFEQLNALMKEWRERAKTEEDAPRPIDRIVLYIDDLDRCSPRQVVDVLQAVHLLLALDLFVVVVGVDPRWLLSSLRSRYNELLADGERQDGDDAWHASPQDYLEKIFNIPLALPRMNPDSFKRLLANLAREGIDGAGAQTQARAGPPPVASPPIPQVSTSGSDGPAPGGRAAAPTDAKVDVEAGSEIAAVAAGDPATIERRPLTDDELAMLTALAPLVETPRETKRLANLYRMIRATRDLSPASSFLGDAQAGQPGEYEAVVILLGLLSGHGRLLEAVLTAPPAGQTDPKTLGGLRHRDTTSTWADFVAGLEPREAENGHRNTVVGPIDPAAVPAWSALHTGLADATARVTLPDLAAFQNWAPRIAHFSFLLSPLGTAD
jgi:KAP family P-loop domain